MPKRKRLTAGQKAQIVMEALREDKSVALIASENNIHPNQIHKWKKQALEDFVHLFVDELYAEIGRLSAQLSWLK
jgi:putative transposase